MKPFTDMPRREVVQPVSRKNDYYSNCLEHGQLVLNSIRANLERDKKPKKKRPKPITPYKNSWADIMSRTK